MDLTDEMLEMIAPDAVEQGWEVGGYGDTLVCPHGDEIEMDGRCPEGCVSPLRSAGMI